MTWILTRTGRMFDPINPRVDDVDVEDIAHALAHNCRFNGHTSRFYSVAEHSLHVSSLVPPEHALVGLLHDAAEAYISDLSTPVKQHLHQYRLIEENLFMAIAEAFGISTRLPDSVKRADLVMLATEKEQLMPHHPEPWPVLEGVRSAGINLPCWSPEVARQEWLRMFYWLTGPRAA